jgi:hypothetical protein
MEHHPIIPLLPICRDHNCIGDLHRRWRRVDARRRMGRSPLNEHIKRRAARRPLFSLLAILHCFPPPRTPSCDAARKKPSKIWTLPPPASPPPRARPPPNPFLLSSTGSIPPLNTVTSYVISSRVPHIYTHKTKICHL